MILLKKFDLHVSLTRLSVSGPILTLAIDHITLKVQFNNSFGNFTIDMTVD